MTSTKPGTFTVSNAYYGPRDDEPLTEQELEILLAIPRAAESAPNSTAFRIPLGIDPSMGWIDVTWSEARSIIALLAAIWNTRLSDSIVGQDASPVGPGMSVCLLVQPSALALFHILAFWALGCTPQFLSLSLDDDTISQYLDKSGCQVVVYAGISERWVEARRKVFDGKIIPLPEAEYAHRLAKAERQGAAGLPPPWPEPRRPTPAVILHSSGTTGRPKLLSFSLYYYTFVPRATSPTPRPVSQAPIDHNIKTPYTHPHLIFSPPYWQSFYNSLFRRILARIPTAFAYVLDIMKVPSDQFIAWVRGLDVGSVMCAPRFLRQALESESDVPLLQSLYKIVTSGSALDHSTSALIEKHGLNFANAYGCTEVTGVLYALRPPYTHLRIPANHLALVHPISDIQPDGSCQVQLWHSPSTSSQVAHLYARGALRQIEPYPGPGPHEGEPAMNLGDVFEQVRLPPNSGSEFAYLYLGRSDDMIKLAGGGGWNMNAAPYESWIQSLIDSRLVGWTVDAVQLFGSNLPCTVLVVQISESNRTQKTNADPQVGNWVEEANEEFKLGPRRRVHTQKRLLVITPDKAYGPGSEYIRESQIRLSTTHKRTLQRWRNVEAFRVWLEKIDYSEP